MKGKYRGVEYDVVDCGEGIKALILPDRILISHPLLKPDVIFYDHDPEGFISYICAPAVARSIGRKRWQAKALTIFFAALLAWAIAWVLLTSTNVLAQQANASGLAHSLPSHGATAPSQPA